MIFIYYVLWITNSPDCILVGVTQPIKWQLHTFRMKMLKLKLLSQYSCTNILCVCVCDLLFIRRLPTIDFTNTTRLLKKNFKNLLSKCSINKFWHTFSIYTVESLNILRKIFLVIKSYHFYRILLTNIFIWNTLKEINDKHSSGVLNTILISQRDFNLLKIPIYGFQIDYCVYAYFFVLYK